MAAVEHGQFAVAFASGLAATVGTAVIKGESP
jgi:O-acetylhomoserine/O-acetylserine sulfhydrylase-like pyridoxal-dependent enzyme